MKLLKTFFILCLSTVAFAITTTEKVSWTDLRDVEFADVWKKEVQAYVWIPTFGESIEKLEGKRIEITGYVIPVDVEEGIYVLSAFPYSSCFFCGNAGPESVMGLKFGGTKYQFATDTYMTFSGTFKTNNTDIYELNYILENATPMSDW